MQTRFATAIALLLMTAPMAGQESSLSDFLEVVGQVRAAATRPVDNALVIAFSLSDDLNLRTSTSAEGRFALPPMPIGVYNVVAVKRGFLPAFATVVPTKKGHDLILQLEASSTASETRKATAWEIRRSLPMDVLRDIDAILGDSLPDALTEEKAARFAGHMESVAGYSGATAERNLERTSVAFRSDVGNWGVDFRGNRQSIEQVEQSGMDLDPATAADVVLEVRSSPSNAYQVTSTRATWQRAPDGSEGAGVETHSVSWQGKRSSVQVRYLSHENLFSTTGPDAEDSLELAGNAKVFQGKKSDLDVSLRLRQDSYLGPSGKDEYQERFADVATDGSYAVARSVDLRYGVATRIGDQTLEIMPKTSARLRFGESASVELLGAYKFDTTPDVPRRVSELARLGDYATLDTRYTYSVTVSADVGESGGVSASATRTAADALTFLLFDDRFDEFWDGLYLHEGEVLTDGAVSVHAAIGSRFRIAVVTSGGRVDRDPGSDGGKYLAGEIRTNYEPSGTSLEVSYRMLEQPDLVDDDVLREIERLSVIVGQSLHLPVDLRLLLGFSVANEAELLARMDEPSRAQKRLVGGVSFSF